ncbi:hypothetical protein M569_06526, partial [Genlisea aurea]
MRRSAAKLTAVVGQALLAEVNSGLIARSWSPSLEKTLHQLGCREFLSSSLVAGVIDSYLHRHPSLAFGFFNWASQQPGFSHDSATCESLLKSLSASRRFGSVEKIMKLVKSQKIILHPSAYRLLISSLLCGRRTQMAFNLFSELGPLVPQIGPEVSNSLLAVLSSEGSMTNAHKVFDEMLHRGIQFNTLGFGLFLWKACRKTSLSEILSFVDRVRNANFSGVNGSVVGLLMIHGFCSESRVKDAVSALEELRRKDCKPDFMAYRIVAEKLREMRCTPDVEMVLKKKRKLSVAPRSTDYRDFIHDLISERLLNESKEIGEVIVSGDFPIEDDTLNLLIGSVSAVDSSQAVSFLKFMIQKDRFPAQHSLIKLCESLCKHKKGDDLVEVLNLLSSKGYFKTVDTYNIMVSFLCKAGKVKEGYNVLQELKRKGLKPDVSSYNSLLDACCRGDLLRPAKRLWDEMFACGCSGNVESYRILIGKFCEVGEMEDARQLLYHMIGKGLEADESTYRSLLFQGNDPKLGLQIFKQCMEHDCVLGRRLLNPFIVFLCNQG